MTNYTPAEVNATLANISPAKAAESYSSKRNAMTNHEVNVVVNRLHRLLYPTGCRPSPDMCEACTARIGATLAAVRILQDAQCALDIAVAESFRDETKIGTWAAAFSGREIVLHAIARLYHSVGYSQSRETGWTK